MKRHNPKADRPTSSSGPGKERWIRGMSDAVLMRALDAQARTNPETAVPRKAGKGRHSKPGFVFMRPVCSDYRCPGDPFPDGDPPPADPCAGQSWVWQPDIAVQLNTDRDCPSAADRARIEHGVGGNLSQFRLPDPEVRVSCDAGKIFIRIWGNRVQPGSCNDLARGRAQIPDLVGGGNFGLFINSSLIRRLADETFQTAPKILSENGAPSPLGPIHLTGLSVGFKPPNIIETYITGYDDRPWPDVQFTTILTDRLKSLRRSDATSHTDTSVVSQVVALLLLGALSVAIPLLLPATAFVLFGDIDAALNEPGNPGQGGVGARLLDVLPAEIPLPQTGGIIAPIPGGAGGVAIRLRRPGSVFQTEMKKLVIAYGEPTVDDRGLFVAALASPQDRIPAIHVGGPPSLSVSSSASETFGNFTALATDLFGKLAFSWTAGANTIIHNPGQQQTKISFRRGSVQPGQSFERTVTVRATDAEGTIVTASSSVTIFVSESGDMLPICQVKPWLPECNP